MFAGKARNQVGHLKGKGKVWFYPQTLDEAGKNLPGINTSLLPKVVNYRQKFFLTLAPG
jgi:hypothetical protein